MKKACRLLLFLCFYVFIFSYFPFFDLPIAYAYPSVYRTGTTFYNPSYTYDGYTLYTPQNPFPEVSAAVVLIDMDGNIVHTWEHPINRIGYAEPLDNGNILAFGYDPEQRAFPTILSEIDWDGNVVWEVSYDMLTERWIHHDFERLANGNTLILCSKQATIPSISPDEIYDDHIIEVNPAGDIIWSWYTSDHYDELGFTPESKQMISDHAGDWSHSNTVSSIPANSLGDSRFAEGNLIVSQRHTNIIFIIDKNTGDIVWKVGPDDNLTIGQHDTKMIEQGLAGAGNMIVFDNGGIAGYPEQARLYSRVVEIDPLTKAIVRQYDASTSGLEKYTFLSGFISGAQRLPNGNTFICEGETGRLFEITPNGKITWEYINPYWATIQLEGIKSREVYRAWRVGPTWPN